MSSRVTVEELRVIASELRALREAIVGAERGLRGHVEGRAPEAVPSVRNLIDYLALRAHDIRPLQDRLASVGLSSLGRCEPHVLSSIDAVLAMLSAASSGDWSRDASSGPTQEEGRALLERHAAQLLGPAPVGRAARIMVTLDRDAATDVSFLRTLIDAGTNLVRINCAHDDARAWERMVDGVRTASREVGRPCLIHMDLAGPKLRTGPVAAPLRFFMDDALLLTRSPDPGRPAEGAGSSLRPARIACTLPRALDGVRVGDSVWFDDGKLGGVAERVDGDGVLVRIDRVSAKGHALEADDGINLPDSEVALCALTSKDYEDLSFVAKNADVVGMSFVQRVEDVREIEARLEALGAPGMGLVLKVETRRAFEALPELLLDVLGRRPVGVMIARGDLAIEVGYERLAEAQEEILWICEAAHVPVIWATQVLERLAKKGMPTRAEVTDAAMAERAECVMLNKGPYIVEATRMLDDILRRMESHQHKKRPSLRPLALSRAALDRQSADGQALAPSIRARA